MKKSLQILLLFFISLSGEFAQAQIISTIAGTGAGSYSGDGGPATAATFNNVFGICNDVGGNIYVVDKGNSAVRKISTSGIVTTIAGGTSGFGGDGAPATAALLSGPRAVAADVLGNLYIADQFNQRIRMVNTSGIITTIVGTGTAGSLGDGGLATAAEINSPSGIVLDAAGNLYIADQANSRIRKVNTS